MARSENGAHPVRRASGLDAVKACVLCERAKATAHHVGCHPERREGSAGRRCMDKSRSLAAIGDEKKGAFWKSLDPEGGRQGCRPFSDETWMPRQKIRNALSARLTPAVSGKALFFGSFL